MTVIKALARAKINLSLDIKGKRPDGYHEIETVMQTISLSDQLIFQPSSDLLLESSDSSLPVNENNTILRAARLLQKYSGRNYGVKIILKKRIPVGAGLGGGSADAAATLLVLNRLWGLDLSEKVLQEQAALVGSDVPFCLTGGTALVQGRGEKIIPLPSLPSARILLAKPSFSLATAVVYRHFKLSPDERHPDTQKIVQAVKKGNIQEVTGLWGNLLEKVSFELFPEIAETKKWLEGYGLPVRMSGSGPVIFTFLPPDFTGSREIKNVLAEKGWWTHEGYLAGEGVEMYTCRQEQEGKHGEKTADTH